MFNGKQLKHHGDSPVGDFLIFSFQVIYIFLQNLDILL